MGFLRYAGQLHILQQPKSVYMTRILWTPRFPLLTEQSYHCPLLWKLGYAVFHNKHGGHYCVSIHSRILRFSIRPSWNSKLDSRPNALVFQRRYEQMSCCCIKWTVIINANSISNKSTASLQLVLRFYSLSQGFYADCIDSCDFTPVWNEIMHHTVWKAKKRCDLVTKGDGKQSLLSFDSIRNSANIS